jgi:hypothetical protein
MAEVEVQRLSAAAWMAYAKGNRDEGLTLMRSAADLEDTSEKHAVTPGRLVPARELLGEMLPTGLAGVGVWPESVLYDQSGSRFH